MYVVFHVEEPARSLLNCGGVKGIDELFVGKYLTQIDTVSLARDDLTQPVTVLAQTCLA